MPSVMCQLLLLSCKQIYFCFDIMFESILWNCHCEVTFIYSTHLLKVKGLESGICMNIFVSERYFMSWTQITETQILSLWNGICTIKELGIVLDNTGISFYFLNYGHERFLSINTSMPAKFSRWLSSNRPCNSKSTWIYDCHIPRPKLGFKIYNISTRCGHMVVWNNKVWVNKRKSQHTDLSVVFLGWLAGTLKSHFVHHLAFRQDHT